MNWKLSGKTPGFGNLAVRFEMLEPRNLLAADLTNLGFYDVGKAGLIYELSRPVPVEQRLEVLNLHANLSPRESFQLQGVEADAAGYTHFTYQQLAYGKPVEHGLYTVHAKAGVIGRISGNYVDAATADPAITLRHGEALDVAIAYATEEIRNPDRHHHGDMHGHPAASPIQPVDNPQFLWEGASGQAGESSMLPKGELLYLETGEGQLSVAYKFDIYAVAPLFRAEIYVDANTGEVLKEREGIHTINVPASGNSLYDGPVAFTADSFGAGPDYRLRTNPGNGLPAVQTKDLQNGESYAQAVDVVSSDTTFNDPDHATGVQVHFGGEQAVEYFAEIHNRNSFNNGGATLQSYFSLLTGYNNAFWDGVRLVFGDGDGVNYSPLVSVDVVGHEFTHGVIQYEADLEYYYESGALNESFADIFGEAIEYHATGSNDWLIGQEFILNGPPIRNLADPNSQGDPDTYFGNNWYTGNDDNGGVHWNSTVPSHWFHILTEGKAGTNDFGESYNVQGIGMVDAGSIAYRSLSTYLTSTSGMADARVAAIQAAIDLFGADSQQHESVEAAWDAVGVYGFELRFQPQQVQPAVGSLIYTDQQRSELFFANVVEETFLKVDAGQTISLQVRSDTVIPSISIQDPLGNLVGSVTGSSHVTALHSVPAAVAGEYTIEISGENNSTGLYDVTLILNAGVEVEQPGVESNNTRLQAENMDGTAVPLGAATADRLAVAGFLGAGAIVHAFEGFESGTYGPQWSLSSSQPNGKIDNWGGPGTASGTQAMIMHQLPLGPFNLNEAILSTDLSGVSGAQLRFWVAEWHEEDHYMPFNSYTGSTDGDGVSLSVDGNTWYTLLDQVQGPYAEYVYHEYDLDSFAASKGISLDGPVQFKFQQFDNDSIYSDGIGWDDIQVSVPSESVDWYSFTLAAGESASISAAAITGSADLLTELFDSAGNLLSSGHSHDNTSNISQFVNAGASDTFYVKLTGTALDYSLVVTRGAEFDIEPNDQSQPRDISNVQGVLGAVFKNRQVSVDPDSFHDGKILDTAIAGLTFSNDVTNGSVWAADTDEIFPAPTGTLVFAPEFGASDGWREFEDELRIDFDDLQNRVSLEFGSDDNEDIGWLRAYGSNHLLLEQKQTGGIPFGASQTLEIDRPQADIAYVVASGFDFHITPLDNLQYTEYVVDEDYYSVTVAAGQPLEFQGILPGGGEYQFENGLDAPTGSLLGMELFDPAGNLIAADNEVISLIAGQAGTYTLRVFAQQGQGEYFISRSIANTDPVEQAIQGTKFLDGVAGSGSLADVVASDDLRWVLLPSPTNNPAKQIIDMIGLAEITAANPQSFGFRLEASMSGGSAGDVLQTVTLWNQAGNRWDVLDNGIATNQDSVVEVFATGDLGNYVHPQTGEIIVKLTWSSPSFTGSPFNWSVNVDQAVWMIG